MRYGLYHPRKVEKYNELVNNGKHKAEFDITNRNGDDIRVKIIRYKGDAWVVHIENGEILEIFSV